MLNKYQFEKLIKLWVRGGVMCQHGLSSKNAGTDLKKKKNRENFSIILELCVYVKHLSA